MVDDCPDITMTTENVSEGWFDAEIQYASCGCTFIKITPGYGGSFWINDYDIGDLMFTLELVKRRVDAHVGA